MRNASARATVVLLLSASGPALADSVSGYAEAAYRRGTADASDPAGSTHQSSQAVLQRYRLDIDQALVPTLRFDGGGLFERNLGWSSGTAGNTTTAGNLWMGNADLVLALATTTTGLGYTRRQVSGLVAEDYHLQLAWRPLDLPAVTVRLARPENHDVDRRVTDIVGEELTISSAWNPVSGLSLRYGFGYQSPEDRIRRSETTIRTHNFTVGYSASVVPRVLDYTLGGAFTRVDTEAVSTGSGGTVETLQSPVAGLSAVETPPATRELVTLQANGALINGDRVASAGINLGTSRPLLANDTSYRDIGVQLADAVTPVNSLYLWLDRDVAEIAPFLRFSAWKSDDNQHWTEVPVLRQVFSGFANRFEITVAETQARYLKLSVAPLDPATTTRDVYADILVTELQVLLVRALPPGGRLRERSNTASFNAGVRARLIPDLLAYDSGFNVRNTTRPGVAAVTTWYWLNGLTLDRRLGEIGFVTARAARQDSDQLRGHEYGYLWGASLSVNELPTLGHGINYSGQANFTRAGTTTANSLVLTTNAVPYRGIAFGFVGSYGIATSGTGRTSVTRSLGVDSSVQPHPVLQLHGAFNHSAAVSTGASLGRASHETDTLEASATLRPVRAFFVTGTVSRVINPPNTATLYNASLGLNATAGGDLQLTVSYASVLDQEGAITRFFTPSARWNIRPNAVLTASYTMVDGDRSGGGSQHQRVLTLDLRITL